MIEIIFITIVFIFSGVSAQECCVWGELGSISSIASVFSAPSSPPTSSCATPYSWARCSNESSCIAIHCTATVSGISISAFAGTCQYTFEDIQTVVYSRGGSVTCSQLQGIFFESTSSIRTEINQTSSLSSAFKQMLTTSVTPSVNLTLNHITSDSIPNLISPPRVSGPSKQRSWLGPTNFFEQQPPSARDAMGFTWADGNLYVFGGYEYLGGASGELYRFVHFEALTTH